MKGIYEDALPGLVILYNRMLAAEYLLCTKMNRYDYTEVVHYLHLAHSSLANLLELMAKDLPQPEPPPQVLSPKDKAEFYEFMVSCILNYNDLTSPVPIKSPVESIVRNLIYASLIKSVAYLRIYNARPEAIF